ncbi:alanine racemase [Agaricicola taiwanensis]|uniref:Alanine racemase n=1 Tax=Agaricicola taiwanensis TaxID=591372 RepID=A0A8J2YJH1_9RHOB|nr:alanine racemase [Agaricicola taiwanensis]GGE46960.1 alanine racemase [Agaricicola taiwanensis]
MTFSTSITSPPALETGALLTIDLGAIVSNWRHLAERASPAECAAVVKANAYGCGITRVAGALSAAGAKTFFVAHAFEGREARQAAPDAAIYVLNGLPPGGAAEMAADRLRPVLGSMAEIEDWSINGDAHPAAIHVDTGMNRLGLSHEEAKVVAERHASGRLGFSPSLFMSHLACADDPEHPLNALQLDRFRQARALFPQVPASLANSAATHQGGDWRFDLCRPGIALYGGNPYVGSANPMRPVVRLEARVIQVREAAAGDTVGYGATQRLTRRSQLAILSIGYADGYFRLAGSSDAKAGAEAVIAGKRCPLVGRISMDLMAVDITDAPAVRRGDMAVLLGEGIDVDEVAAHAQTIGYEVLTDLGRRYHRIYRPA